MKTAYYKMVIVLSIMLSISLCMAMTAYSFMDDRGEWISSSQANVFSPGYINSAKQKTDAIISQLNNKKNFMDRAMDYIKDKLTNEVAEDAGDKSMPELKKKASMGSDNGTVKSQVQATTTLFPSAENSDKAVEGANQKGVVTTTLSNKNVVSVWMEDNNAYFSLKNSAGDVLVGKQKFNADDNMQKSYVSDIRDMGQGKFAILVTAYTYASDNDLYKYDSVESMKVYDSAGATERQDNYQSYDYWNLNTGEHTYDYNSISKMVSADLNRDGVVDFIDLGMLARQYGTSGAANGIYSADINGDGIVDVIDLGILSKAYDGDSVSTLAPVVTKDNYYPADFKYSHVENTNSMPADTFLLSKPSDNESDFKAFNPSAFTINDETKMADYSGKTKNVFNDPKVLKPETAKGVDDMGPVMAKMLIDKDALLMYGNIPKAGENPDRAEDGLTLASIMHNPTESQKLILDMAVSLMNETDKRGDPVASPDLKRAQSDMLQAVASVILAQAIPDLLKEGDISNIKNIFAELNSTKAKIMADYQESIKPYYDEIKKLLSKNMAMLQLNNIISNGMTSEELAKLQPGEVDKILEKLHKASSKSFEQEYMLQQEAKYRKQYVDPNNKAMDDKMKAMMKDFTKRIATVLESAAAAKK
jgi:hypothetical protein